MKDERASSKGRIGKVKIIKKPPVLKPVTESAGRVATTKATGKEDRLR